MRHVFVALVEIRPLRTCRILDPAEVNGAVVRCYIPARDETSARQKLAGYLEAQRLKIVATEWIVREDQVEWENTDDPIVQRLIDEARKAGKIAIGEFHTWGHDAPDAHH